MRANQEPRVAAWVKTDPAGPLRPVGGGSPPAHLGAAEWVWVDVSAPTLDVALELGQRFRLPDHIVEDTVDPTVFPKWEDHDDRLLVVVHLPTTGEAGSGEAGDREAGDREAGDREAGDREAGDRGGRDGRAGDGLLGDADVEIDTMPVVCLLGEDLLLTFHPQPHPGLRWLLGAVSQHAALADGGPDRMLGRLVDFAAREFGPLVEGCDEACDALADRALQGDPGVLSDTQALRRDVSLLRRVLGPQLEVVLGLAGSDSPLVGDDARRRLRDAYDRHNRLVQEIDAARNMLASVADTYRAAVAERTNDVMKVLTVFSAMLLPLTVIAGVYGMNFEYMPELGRRWAYPAVLAVMATVVVALWIHFVRRGFIGGPRVGGVSRTVGRGMVGMARAPVRTVGALVLRPTAPAPSSGPGRTLADLDRETVEVVADLFRLGWQAPRTILATDDDGANP